MIRESIKGQVVVITGAASGIGLATAYSFLEKGMQLALFDYNLQLLEQAFASELSNEHVFLQQMDVRSEPEVRKAIEQVENRFGTIDVLINSAGITGETAILTHETKTDNVQNVMDVNFMGSYYTAKYVLPIMQEKGYGRVLHVASVAGKEGNVGMLAYSASKAAVIGMTKVQGKEYAEKGITVNAIAPSVIQTALVEALPQSQVDYMLNKVPMKRLCTLKEVTDLIGFIVSPENSFTTGFTYDITGGRATY